MKTEAIETQLGLPALQNLAYSQAETIAEHEVSTPWRDAYVKAARMGLIGACTAMGIIASSYAIPHHQWTTATTEPIAGASNSAEPPQDVPPRPLVIPPDAEKISQDDRFFNVFNKYLAPYGLESKSSAAETAGWGLQICKHLAQGSSVQQIVDDNSGPNDVNDFKKTPDEERAIIRAAQEVFCPNLTG
jgi:Protein of unknown function (DUF732)